MLPTVKSTPITDISGITMLLYGPPKVGKSTFCSRFPNGFFVATEPGLNHLETYNLRADTWEQALDILSDIESDPKRFSPIIVDTIDKLWDFCLEYTVKKNNCETILDMAYGRGYALASGEFRAYIQRLVALRTGLIFISHHDYDKFMQTDGIELKKFMPSIPARARDIIMPLVDIIAFAGIEYQMNPKDGTRIERRVMHTQPGILYEAGDRTGRLPASFPFSYHVFTQLLTAKKD